MKKEINNLDNGLNKKPHVVAAPKKFSCLEKVETGLRSPTTRQLIMKRRKGMKWVGGRNHRLTCK
jgi:hypothetical protein